MADAAAKLVCDLKRALDDHDTCALQLERSRREAETLAREKAEAIATADALRVAIADKQRDLDARTSQVELLNARLRKEMTSSTADPEAHHHHRRSSNGDDPAAAAGGGRVDAIADLKGRCHDLEQRLQDSTEEAASLKKRLADRGGITDAIAKEVSDLKGMITQGACAREANECASAFHNAFPADNAK